MQEDEDMDEVEVLEECPKKPITSQVRSAIDVLTSYSLFVNKSAGEIRSLLENLGISWKNLQELPTTAGTAFIFFLSNKNFMDNRTTPMQKET